MTKLPVVSGKDAAAAFKKLGYELDHQTGSHMILFNLLRHFDGSRFQIIEKLQRARCVRCFAKQG